MHDLRHTFVLRTLLNWYREDADVEAQLPLLATFLGHVEPPTRTGISRPRRSCSRSPRERLERTWEEQSTGARERTRHLRSPGSAPDRDRPPRTKGGVTALAPLLQAFFAERLARQRHASPHTIAAYRDSFRLLLTFVHQQTGKTPSKLKLEDLDAATIAAFLAHLETERGNSVRTRNARLTAIHSFFHYAALKARCAELIARVLAIPEKRFDTTLISYLDEPEIDALLAARTAPRGPAGATTRCCLLAVQTGLRASELASLRRQDLQLGAGLGQVRRQRQKGTVHARSAAPPGRCSERGCASSVVTRPARCSPPVAADTSPAARSGGWSSSTWQPPAAGVHRSRRRTSRRTRCATPRRCGCCTPPDRSIPQRSRCGSATRRSTRPTSTSTPTWRSSNARSTAPHPPNAKPGRYRPPDPLLAFLESL